jgi:hypothetical protein
MIEKRISLVFVRLAARKPLYPDMLNYAATNSYQPVLSYDGKPLYGHAATLDTKGELHVQ